MTMTLEFNNSTIILILYCILAFLLAFYPAYLIFPRFMRKLLTNIIAQLSSLSKCKSAWISI